MSQTKKKAAPSAPNLDTNLKPQTHQISDFGNLPAVLKPLTKLKVWVIWKWERKKDGKWTKVPYQAASPNYKASSIKPQTWSDFKIAVAVAERRAEGGIGFMLRDLEYGAFDIDDCRDPETGVIHPWALNLVEKAGSYTEITPSGTGLRIIGRATGAEIHRKQTVPAANGVSLETFRKAERFITVTGNVLPGTKQELADLDALMDAVVAELDGMAKAKSDDEEITFKGADEYEEIAPDDPRLSKLPAKWKALGHDGAGMEQYGKHRSQAVMAFACECYRAGIDVKVLAACLMRWKIGEHIRNQSNVKRALNRVIERARQFVEDSKLYEMNESHCVLPIGSRTRVATWGEEPDFPGRKTIVRFSSFDDFRALNDKYRHTFTTKDKKGNPTEVTMGLGSWWIAQQHRRQYDGGMRFMPSRNEDVVGDILNLWQGFAVPARKPEGKSGAAGCNLFLDHGLKIICSGDEEHYDYLIKREALIAQKRIRSEIAVALRTEEEGTGKGFWARTLNHPYGVHAMQVQNSAHVMGKHNRHLETLLRLTADEALFAGDPRHRNALYTLITEPTLTIEPKNIDAYSAYNNLNLDVLSNEKHFIPVSGTARRLFVPTVSSARANDHKYFHDIDVQLKDGGYEALLYHLLYEIDIKDFNVRDVPKTAALAEQAAYSRKGLDLLVEKACNEAVVPCPHSEWAGFSDNIGHSDPKGYDDRKGFDYFIDHHPDQELRRLGSLTVKRRLKKDWDCVTGDATRKQSGGVRGSGIDWPPLQELREKFEARHGKQQWLADVTEWQLAGM